MADVQEMTSEQQNTVSYWRERAEAAEARVDVLEKRSRYVRQAMWATTADDHELKPGSSLDRWLLGLPPVQG